MEERWLHWWKDPTGHARVIAEMDKRGDTPPVEWRRPLGLVRRDEAHVNNGEPEAATPELNGPRAKLKTIIV